MSGFELLTVDVGQSGVGTVTLNRPDRRNALSAALAAELKQALKTLDADPQVRVIALGGAGPDFCAGADLQEVRDSVEAGVLASLEDARSLGELFSLPRRLGKPVVALVHGRALAGGCGLATACDLVLAAETASFGYPEVRLGFVPAMVMAILRRNLGEKRAFELVATGESLSASDAAAWGLINRVWPDETFAEESRAYLEQLAGQSPSALALTKQLLRETDGVSFEAAISRGAQTNAIARLTDDCQAGISRFLDRKGGMARG